MPTSALIHPSPLHPPIPTTNNKRTPKPNKTHFRHHHPLRISAQQTNPSPPTPLFTTLTNLLWGKSLPPQLLISAVRTTWTSTWHLMMSQLAPSDHSGSYSRPPSKFRANFKSLPTPRQNQLPRLHLYAALPCPWAHRALIVRALKGLEDFVPVSIASPGIDGSWEFIDAREGNDVVKHYVVDNGGALAPSLDMANGCRSLREVYRLMAGGYDGRSTAPMLWDVERRVVFCNESYDIIELFNSGFNNVAGNPGLDLCPPSLKGKIEEWNAVIYPNVNNGVYRCGFAQSQEAYDLAVNGLFSTLDMMDDHLADSRYLCGDVLTLADICLFTTLIRFDLVYNVLFKCTKKKVVEYSNLHAYMRDIYQAAVPKKRLQKASLIDSKSCKIWVEPITRVQDSILSSDYLDCDTIPKVAATCNLNAMIDGYYKFLFPLNPGNIRPVMPSGSEHAILSKPHDRESLSSLAEQRVGYGHA
ncbi:hypothetical protein Scep_010322 [Stephania cephalantha]|uniref:GST C-terminal domain-containing protein n=1 Tax=Stephania cephalantha TaxID=152367 RepID=A0AAP0JV83_9MAGN